MPSVVVSHMIGTAGIIALFFVIMMYSGRVYFVTELDSTKLVLQDVAEYVGSEAVGVAAIAERTDTNNTIYKTLNIPTDVNNKGYNIRFENSSLGWTVVASLDQYPSIKGEALLNIKSGVHLDNSTRPLYSGTENPAIICQRNGTGIYLELGGMP